MTVQVCFRKIWWLEKLQQEIAWEKRETYDVSLKNISQYGLFAVIIVGIVKIDFYRHV